MMAHAIDIACPDARPAPRARGARAIGPWTRRRGATRPGHSVARGGLQLCRDRRDDGRALADARLVEAALREGRPSRPGRHRGSTPSVLTPALEARIMTWTR